MKPLFVCILDNIPIFEQLRQEEAILRTCNDNWCFINTGSTPAIVMGISGKADELIDKERYLLHRNIPIIRRFSGGGTVVVDQETLFVSFIFEKSDFSPGEYPKDVFNWSEALYRSVFPCNNFSLQEHDYAFGDRKIGGNAQYFTKTRWLHHTSFLWDFDPEKMKLLKKPLRMPVWRKEREHMGFIDKLSRHLSNKQDVIAAVVATLSERFNVKVCSWEDVLKREPKAHRQALTYVSWP